MRQDPSALFAPPIPQAWRGAYSVDKLAPPPSPPPPRRLWCTGGGNNCGSRPAKWHQSTVVVAGGAKRGRRVVRPPLFRSCGAVRAALAQTLSSPPLAAWKEIDTRRPGIQEQPSPFTVMA